MTPTEQDKELRRAIVNYRIKCDYYLSDRDDGVISQEEYETAISSELDASVELITSLIKELVAEAKPEITFSKPEGMPNTLAIDFAQRHLNEFEQNLLKALEEV